MKAKKFNKVTIIIPVYNEASTIKKIVDRVKRANYLGLKKEIIIIDDHSTDDTRQILKTPFFKDSKVIFQPKNKGKGSAVRAGIKASTGQIILIQDADLEYHPKDYTKSIRLIIEKDLPVVFGSRELTGKNPHSYLSFHIGGKLVTTTTNLLYGSKLSDVPTGHKIFQADILKSVPLKCKRFEFCPEVTGLLLKKNIPIHEVPISYSARTIQEGKKIKAKDGLEAIWTLFRVRFLV
jgi:dolichol-phosphate mannosyltransferase